MPIWTKFWTLWHELCVKDFTDGNNSERSWRWGSWCASFERNPGTLFLFAVGKSVMVKLFKTPSNCSIYVGWHICICILICTYLHIFVHDISYNIYMFAFAHNSWYILPMAPSATSVHFFHSPQVVETLSLQETLAARERQLREAKAGQECWEAIATCDWLVTDFMTWDWIHLENTEKCFLYFFVRCALFEDYGGSASSCCSCYSSLCFFNGWPSVRTFSEMVKMVAWRQQLHVLVVFE